MIGKREQLTTKSKVLCLNQTSTSNAYPCLLSINMSLSSDRDIGNVGTLKTKFTPYLNGCTCMKIVQLDSMLQTNLDYATLHQLMQVFPMIMFIYYVRRYHIRILLGYTPV